jgi:hypothetical protein
MFGAFLYIVHVTNLQEEEVMLYIAGFCAHVFLHLELTPKCKTMLATLREDNKLKAAFNKTLDEMGEVNTLTPDGVVKIKDFINN